MVPLPLGKNPVGCLWVFTIKVGPIVDCLEAHFLVKDLKVSIKFLDRIMVILFLLLPKWMVLRLILLLKVSLKYNIKLLRCLHLIA